VTDTSETWAARAKALLADNVTVDGDTLTGDIDEVLVILGAVASGVLIASADVAVERQGHNIAYARVAEERDAALEELERVYAAIGRMTVRQIAAREAAE
jgi:hypothetical protein